MRALKILVVVMGVMLVAGVAVLVGTIAMRLGQRAGPSAPVSVMAPNGERRVVELPAGAKVIAVQGDGDRVMVRLGLAGGGEELILIDWKTGARLGTIELKAAEPGTAKP